MAIGIVIEIPGGTREQYDKVMEKMELDGKPSAGGIFHVAGPTERGWRVVDVWESKEAFQAFFDTKLGKALKEVGVPPLSPSFFPVHNIISKAA
jgi:hypothetical protein